MYLLNFNFKFFGVEFDLLQTCTERRHFDLIADLDLELWAFFPFKTSRIRWFPTGTLRKWNPRPACGTAFTSVRISMSVCVVSVCVVSVCVVSVGVVSVCVVSV